MQIINFFHEVRKLLIDNINPETIRIDPLPSGTYLSCGSLFSDMVISAKFHSPIEGLDEPIAFSQPKILSRLLDAPAYRGDDAKASFVSSGGVDRHFLVSNSLGSLTQITVLGGSSLNNFARRVSPQLKKTELLFPISALWKQQFEYWSKFEHGNVGSSTASFVGGEDGLFCHVGNHKFDHHIWRCESDTDSGFISAISFQCAPMIKALKLFPYVKRMSISISTDSYLVVKANGFAADYTFLIPGSVPYWYLAARLPVYDIDDPRSVMQQRLDEN